MTIFAADYTDRTLVATAGMVFKLINTAMTLVPAALLTWLLFKLYRGTGGRVWLANLTLAVAFAIIWGLCLWMLGREFAMDQSEVPATWFGVLNSFFIVVLAPMFSKLWEEHWNPSLARSSLASASSCLASALRCARARRLRHRPGAKTAQVSMMYLTRWLTCCTPWASCACHPSACPTSQARAPVRLLGLMFGFWYLNAAIAHKLGGSVGVTSTRSRRPGPCPPSSSSSPPSRSRLAVC